jgi:hypothetical protein
MKKYSIVILFAAIGLITACETADDNNLESARTCLDNASRQAVNNPSAAATAASTCDTMVTSMTSPESGKIGFGAMLLVEQKFSQIPGLADALKSSTNSLATGFSLMVFASQPNLTKMLGYATRSASLGIQKIALYIQSATLVATAGAIGTSPTPAQVQTAVAGLNAANANSAGTENSLATNLVSLQQNACAGAGATTDNCTKLTQAVGPTPGDLVSVITAFKAFVAGGS